MIVTFILKTDKFSLQAWFTADSIKYERNGSVCFILSDGRPYTVKKADILSIE